jgi:hypothetical protein
MYICLAGYISSYTLIAFSARARHRHTDQLRQKGEGS